MAQVTFKDNTATVVFDDPEMVVLNEAIRRNRDFLQEALMELLRAHGRAHNNEIIQEKIAEIRGQFGRLPVGLA